MLVRYIASIEKHILNEVRFMLLNFNNKQTMKIVMEYEIHLKRNPRKCLT